MNKKLSLRNISVSVTFVADDYSSHTATTEFPAGVSSGTIVAAMSSCVPALFEGAENIFSEYRRSKEPVPAPTCAAPSEKAGEEVPF